MWSEVWPFILTALLTLVATLAVHLIVQFYAVPRVETRKRREQRWDEDVLRLGELLTLEQPAAASALFEELWWRRILHEMLWRPPIAENWKESWDKAAKHRHGAAAEYRRLSSRVDWLGDRIRSIAPAADGLAPFVKAAHAYQNHSDNAMELVYTSLDLAGPPDEEYSREAIREAERAERASVQQMISTLKTMAGQTPPRSALRMRRTNAEPVE